MVSLLVAFTLILPSCGFHPFESVGHRQRPNVKLSMGMPKLIVFDLDNTLWTPELYQLRKRHGKENFSPTPRKDVNLMKGAEIVLEKLVPQLQEQGVQFAIASRTKSVEWAHALLGQFGIKHIMNYVEIMPGNKRNHFLNIKRASGIEFDEMLFFDDARDGKFGNCEPICKMGVLSVHCPNGLDTVDVFISGLERFKEWDKSPNLIVEWDGSVTDTSVVNTERLTGVVKMVNEYKQYGFVRYRKGRTRDVFFHFRNLAEGIPHIQEGQEVSFHLIRDSNTKKYKAGNIVLEGTVDKEGVQMRCFSMNQPFAALVVNGYKTLETRTGTMFDKYAEGTQMLLHVGRRNYPDEGKHIDVMKSEGMDDAEIAKLKSLPQGYGRGNVVAIVELGKTYEATLEERCNPDFQRKVAAYGADSGRMCTEIKRVSYLKKPIKTQGQGGVFKVRIDPDVIPDGWSIPPNDVSDVYASISG